jgi:hypothetical protein
MVVRLVVIVAGTPLRGVAVVFEMLEASAGFDPAVEVLHPQPAVHQSSLKFICVSRGEL